MLFLLLEIKRVIFMYWSIKYKFVFFGYFQVVYHDFFFLKKLPVPYQIEIELVSSGPPDVII